MRFPKIDGFPSPSGLGNIPVIFPGLYENVIATSSIHQMLDQINASVCRSQNHISKLNNVTVDIIACQ